MIDWSRINELRDEIGEEDLQEVIELFLSEVEEALDGLDNAAREARQLESSMHFLKGSALNLGFSKLSTLCQKGEHAAAQGRLDAIDIDTVKELFLKSRDAFLRGLPDQFAA